MAPSPVHSLLGIMVFEKKGQSAAGLPPFPELGYYKRLCTHGRQLGMTVYVFSPLSIRWTDGTVPGYTYLLEKKRWQLRSFPLPQAVYDRCFYESRSQYRKALPQIRKLREMKPIAFLGNGLSGKRDVLELLQSHSDIAPHIPPTAAFEGAKTLRPWLARYREVLLKPHSGSQGKGIAAIKKTQAEAFEVSGRDRANRPFAHTFARYRSLLEWLIPFIGKRRYLIQPFLSLTTSSGEAYDIRILMQKNRKGLWHQTGMAARVGKPGSVTSNLHGGGHAHNASDLLRNEFGESSAKQIQEKIGALSAAIPHMLENRYGRMLELGIDVGIDRQRNIWLLEVNSKPGRQVFAQIRDRRARRASILNPIYYARFLLDRHLGG